MLGLCKTEEKRTSSYTTPIHPGLAQHLALARLLEIWVLVQFCVESIEMDPVLGRSSLDISGSLRGLGLEVIDGFKVFYSQLDPVPALEQVWQPERLWLSVELMSEPSSEGNSGSGLRAWFQEWRI